MHWEPDWRTVAKQLAAALESCVTGDPDALDAASAALHAYENKCGEERNEKGCEPSLDEMMGGELTPAQAKGLAKLADDAYRAQQNVIQFKPRT